MLNEAKINSTRATRAPKSKKPRRRCKPKTTKKVTRNKNQQNHPKQHKNHKHPRRDQTQEVKTKQREHPRISSSQRGSSTKSSTYTCCLRFFACSFGLGFPLGFSCWFFRFLLWFLWLLRFGFPPEFWGRRRPLLPVLATLFRFMNCQRRETKV